MRTITNVLIANRSEVALRIQAACGLRGLKTVAIFSPEDRYASYVYQADQNHQLSGSGYQAYCNQDEIISIAKATGADAIHPGYGFLAENAVFAQAVINAGLVWIGPRPEAMALMADKHTARTIMAQAGVPVLPGFMVSSTTDPADLLARAQAIGFPLIIKDPQGGGGKAMQVVHTPFDVIPAFNAVARQAAALTGSNQLLIEAYIAQGRHVEVQVAGDGTRWVHLFERECSVQRRHQKVIEEAPCRFISQEVLAAMYNAALKAAAAVDYDSIGTVEFIVTPDERFYFLEMNTRLQVEHAVTEMVTGIDLIDLQLEIAQTGRLSLQQEDIAMRGHALECRLYAEDPVQHFFPSTGALEHVFFPRYPFVRFEHDIATGTLVTSLFDPMIAKIISFGRNRDECIRRMQQALAGSRLVGVATNKDLLQAILASDAMQLGQFYTALLDNPAFVSSLLAMFKQPINSHDAILAAIAALLYEHELQVIKHEPRIMPSRRWRTQRWR